MNIKNFTLINTKTNKPVRTARKPRQPRVKALVNAGSDVHELQNSKNAALFCQPSLWEQYSRANGYSAEREMYRSRWNLD